MNFLAVWMVIIIGVVGFELWGVHRAEPNDTITETFRLWISLIPFAWGRWLAKVVLSGGAAWLILHIWGLA